MILPMLFLFGCLTVEQSVRINSDESIIASYTYSYQTDYEDALKAALVATMKTSGLAENNPADFLNEDGVTKFCNDNGIELRQYKKTAKNGKTTVQIIVLARRTSPEVLLALGNFVRKEKRFEMVLPEIKWPDQLKATLKQMCPDMALSLTVVAPGDIRRTNGKKLRPDTVNWTFTPDDGLFALPTSLYIEF